MTLAMATERSGFPETKLVAWEKGELVPTLRQAEKLAEVYHRPYSVLCMEQPPVYPPLAKEYRRLPGVTPGKESPELRFALRDMIQRRRVTLRLLSEVGDDPAPFTLKASMSRDAEAVAGDIREALGIPVSTQLGWQNEFQAWRAWRAAVENLGVLVFQFSKVAAEEVRGVSLLDYPLPVIGVNSKEVPLSKPFTLIHELVHLLLANAHEEVAAMDERRPAAEWEKLEGFAESVAGAVLVPGESLHAEAAVRGHRGGDWEVADIRSLARRFTVTPTALITRLLVTGKCSPAAYTLWKTAWAEWQKTHPAKPGFGIATPAEKALNRAGTPFAKLVLEALSMERITSTDAAHYLGVHFGHVQTLQRDLSLSPAAT